MPTKAAAAQTTTGSKAVVKTFVQYYDANGEVIQTSSLGIGTLNVDVAGNRAHDKSPEDATKYKIFVAQANIHGRPRLMSPPVPRTGRRMLRF